MNNKKLAMWMVWFQWRWAFIALGVICLTLALLLAIWPALGAQSPTSLPQITRVCTGSGCQTGAQYDYVKNRNQLTPGGTIPTDAQTQGGWDCVANCAQPIPRVSGVGSDPYVIGAAVAGAVVRGVIADNDHTDRTLSLTRCDGVALIDFKSGSWGDTFTFEYAIESDGVFCVEGTESGYGAFEVQPAPDDTPTPTSTPTQTPTLTPPPTLEPTVTPVTPTITPTATTPATPTLTVTASIEPTVTPEIATATPTVTPLTPTVTPTATATATDCSGTPDPTGCPSSLPEGEQPGFWQYLPLMEVR